VRHRRAGGASVGPGPGHDFSALAPYGDERAVLDLLLSHFEPRQPDSRAFAMTNRVLLVKTPAGVEIDVALAAFSFEVDALELASSWEIIHGVSLRACPAEHMIVYKLVAARPHDISDVEGIVQRQRHRLDIDRIDIDRIRHWGRIFAELKDDPDLLRPFEDVWRKIGPGR
jgi:hypothetical protein